MSNPTILVSLEKSELFYAAFGGFMRTITARLDGRKLEAGRSDEGFDYDVLGMITEFAVAKHYNRFYSPKAHQLDTKTGDLKDLQVKGIARADLSLIVRENDLPDFKFVLGLVNFADRTVELLGWLRGVEAKVPQFWREKDRSKGIHRSAYFVPQENLHPMESLEF